MHKKLLFAALLTMTSMTSHAAANDINSLQLLAQSQFSDLSDDLSAALSYKSLSDAEAGGVTGFDLGLDITAVDISNSQAWKLASSGNSVNIVGFPKIFASKGLPANINVEGFYTEVPNSNIALWGAAVKYSFLEGSVATPAVAVRGGYTKLSGVDQVDFSSNSIELLVSKGLANFTPYAGIGQVWSTVDPNVTTTPPLTPLVSEDVSQTKLFAGINVSLLIVKLGVYIDQTGDTTGYGLRLGVGL